MQQNNRFITVKGVGIVTARPDQIVLNMEFEVIKVDYDEAINCGGLTHKALLNAVVNAGHNEKALKTSKFNISTKYESYKDENNNWKKKFEGYRYLHCVKLEFDYNLELLSKTLNEIATSGVVPHIEIKFTVKEPSNITDQLLENAVMNAESSAKILAKSSGVSLGSIIRIDYNWSDIHLYSETDGYMSTTCALMKSDSFEDIEPDDVKASDSVTVIWEIV